MSQFLLIISFNNLQARFSSCLYSVLDGGPLSSRYNIIFKNGIILLLYNCQSNAEFFIIIKYFDPITLTCTSKNLLKSFIEVTPYCVISGNTSNLKLICIIK